MAESDVALALHADGPLPEALVSDLARKGLRLYLDSAHEPPEVHRLWQRLVESAVSSEATEKYLGSVCNALSVFLTISLKSKHSNGFCFIPAVWNAAYSAVQRIFDKGKTKPGLQLLETLCLLLNQDPDPLVASNLLHEAVRGLIKTIFVGGLQHNVKVACIGLSCFLRRTDIVRDLAPLVAGSLSEVRLSWAKTLHRYHLPNQDQADDDESPLRSLILALYITISGLDARSAALKLLKLLCTSLDKVKSPRWGLELSAVLFAAFVAWNPDLLADFAENVLPIILDTRQSWDTFEALCRPTQPKPESDSEPGATLVLYLIVLRVGRLKAYIGHDGQLPYLQKSDRSLTDLIPDVVNCLWQTHLFSSPRSDASSERDERKYSIYLTLFRSANPIYRIHAYNLATTSSSSRDTVSPSALPFIAQGLKYLYDDNDSYQRGEILSITRRFFKKLDTCLAVRDEPTAPTSILHPDPTFVSICLSFFHDLRDFLKRELDPAVSYPRHILALETLRIFLSLPSAHNFDKASLLKPLLNLILDPFEDVREVSAGLCHTLLTNSQALRLQVDLWKISRRVQLLSAKTGRHDHADAAARFYALAHSIQGPKPDSATAIQSLAQHLAPAQSLPHPSAFPLHALLLGATYQLLGANLDESDADILPLCRRVWHLVQDRLCLDSPETADPEFEQSFAGPKDLLAYSWRALRDSSLLLQAMLKSSALDLHTLRETGSLCFEQLTMLRHRGAFSTVAQTFTLCCELARTSSDPDCKDLNQLWYGWAVDEIERQAGRLTRRSAGLPALINSVLSPQDTRFFHSVITYLTSRSRQPVSSRTDDEEEVQLPQVHALNCIKDIMHNSRFRAVNEPYVSQLLELAADSLTSGTWAIRNSGLMLLNACMVRLEPNGSASRISTGHYGSQSTRAEPLKVAISLLERASTLQERAPTHESEQESGENIFAALDLVKYVGRAEEESPYLRSLIQRQLGSHVWAIRDQAARVLVDRLRFEDSISSDFLSLWPLPEVSSENAQHGSLILYRYFMREHYEHSPIELVNQVLGTWPHNLRMLTGRVRPKSSPYTKAALLDLVNDWAAFILKDGRTLPDADMLVGCFNEILDQDCNAYLRARVFLVQALIYILFGYEVSTLQRFLLIGEASLEALRSEMVGYLDETRIDVLSRIALGTAVADVRSLAMTALANTLETNGEMVDYIGKSEMSHTRLALSHLVEREYTNERELWNSRLRIRPFVSPTLQGNGAMFDQNEWVSLLDDIRDTGEDVSEFPTRFSAGLGLRSAGRSFTTPGTALLERPIPAFWSILYNQLNDDDEEIRAIAGQTVSLVIGTKTDVRPRWCALSGREEIINRVSTLYIVPRLHLDLIRALALCHVFGLYASVDDSWSRLRAMIGEESIGSKMQRISASVHELFAEEKQNLYVDELEEVDIWCTVLRQADGNLITREVGLLEPWLLEGMDEIRKIIEVPDGEDDFPLGPTYHHDILLLSVRVVSVASVLTESEAKISSKSALATRLASLRSIYITKNNTMDRSKTILICVIVIPVVVGLVAFKFWKWYIMEPTVDMAQQETEIEIYLQTETTIYSTWTIPLTAFDGTTAQPSSPPSPSSTSASGANSGQLVYVVSDSSHECATMPSPKPWSCWSLAAKVGLIVGVVLGVLLLVLAMFMWEEDNNPYGSFNQQDSSNPSTLRTSYQDRASTPPSSQSHQQQQQAGPLPRKGGYDGRIQQILYENPELDILIVDAGKSPHGGFIEYRIRTGDIEVARRYSEFASLRAALVNLHPTLVIPPIPEKHSMADYAAKPTKAKQDTQIIEQRKRMLAVFLNRCRRMQQVLDDGVWWRFLDPNSSWNEVLHAHPISSIPKNNLKAPPLDPANASPGHQWLPLPSSSAKLKSAGATSSSGTPLGHPDTADASATPVPLFGRFPIASEKLSESELDPYFINFEASTRELELLLQGNVDKVNQRTLSHLQKLSTDLEELGARYNGFSLSEQSLPVAAAIERVGQAVDQTYISTGELAQALGANFAEPMRESAQFAGVVRTVLRYRVLKRVQQEMTRDELEKKKKLLDGLERSELEAKRIDAFLASSTTFSPPRRSRSDASNKSQVSTASAAPATTTDETESVDSDFPPTHGEVAASSSPPSAAQGQPEAQAGPTHRKTQSGNFVTNRLFGSFRHAVNGFVDVDPERTRRDQIGKTRESLVQLEQALEVSEKDVHDATQGVIGDLTRFQRDKEDDLQRYMIAYARCQIEWAKKNVETWTEAKEEVDKIVDRY
ncbi:hypothetical protein DV735_g1703, partial [Chaetothyriales sp. CBS 134920]